MPGEIGRVLGGGDDECRPGGGDDVAGGGGDGDGSRDKDNEPWATAR